VSVRSPTYIKADPAKDILASTSFAGYEHSMTVAYQTTNVTHGPWTHYFVSNDTCGGQLEGVQFSMVPGSHRAHPNLHATAISTQPPSLANRR
jgi:hypothetical protein